MLWLQIMKIFFYSEDCFSFIHSGTSLKAYFFQHK